MKAIQVVIDHMHDTLAEADDYYRDYIMFKDTAPRVASTSLEMAKTHLSLYMKWHEIVVAIITEHKEKGHQVPPIMQSLYDYEHKKLVEEFDELSYKIKKS